MGLRSLIGLISVILTFSLIACDSDKAQKVEPETRGKRGETCLARNECATGLACISGVCSKNEFDIDVSVKHCDRIECSTDEQCCGDRLTEAPAVCKGRESICLTPTIPNCIQTTCTAAGACPNGGTCSVGTCSFSGTACMAAADCLDTCGVNGFCTVSTNVPCTLPAQCNFNGVANTCGNRICNCANPDFNQNDPVCTNEDCLNVCTLRCESQLCVEDDSCEVDLDCTIAAPICDGGRCVQCTQDSECDEVNEETCEKGFCHRPCEFNEECGIFEECQAGDCIYVGCRSDRECVLVAGRGFDGVGGTGNVSSLGDDARLAVCLPSDTEADINVCKIPCENDGNCSQLQICEAGYCKFVGCETDEECRSYLGIANQVISEAKPYVATAICTDQMRSTDN